MSGPVIRPCRRRLPGPQRSWRDVPSNRTSSLRAGRSAGLGLWHSGQERETQAAVVWRRASARYWILTVTAVSWRHHGPGWLLGWLGEVGTRQEYAD